MGLESLLCSGSGSSSSSSSMSISTAAKNIGDKTFKGVGNLIKLLPSGTVFLFQLLNPLLTNAGSCTTLNKALAGALLAVCAFSCCFSCFTDSYTSATDAKVYYGLVTATGLLPFWDPNAAATDFSKYKLRFADFVHALLSLLVFAVISLLDSNCVACFFPSFKSQQKVLLMVLPPAVGAVASTTFVLFPNTRHGIGYPATTTAADTTSASSS